MSLWSRAWPRLHAVFARLETLRRYERANLSCLLVVERDVGDEIADDGERTHRGDRDGALRGQRRHTRHAEQPRTTVDLCTAGTALACLAVPTNREVGRLRGLQAMDHIEDNLTLVDLDVVVPEVATLGIAAPHTKVLLVAHQFFLPESSASVKYFVSSSISNRSSRSSRIGTCCLAWTSTEPSSLTLQTSN